MDSEVIARLKELDSKATAGPWYQAGPLSEEECGRAGGMDIKLVVVDPVDNETQHDMLDDPCEKDIAFIAELRTHARALIRAAELSEARKRVCEAQARYMPLMEWDGVHGDTCQCRQCEYLRATNALAALEVEGAG